MPPENLAALKKAAEHIRIPVATGERIHFQPGLIPYTMRWTNRPTFQQLMEFSSHRPR